MSCTWCSAVRLEMESLLAIRGWTSRGHEPEHLDLPIREVAGRAGGPRPEAHRLRHGLHSIPVETAGPGLRPQPISHLSGRERRAVRPALDEVRNASAAASTRDGIVSWGSLATVVAAAVAALVVLAGEAATSSRAGIRERMRSLWYACSRAWSRSVRQRPGLSQIRLEMPTRPTSCRKPARRTVRTWASRPNGAAAAEASSATPEEWPCSHGLFRSTRSPKVRATASDPSSSTRGPGPARIEHLLVGVDIVDVVEELGGAAYEDVGEIGIEVGARSTAHWATAAAAPACRKEHAVEATCITRVLSGISAPAAAG